MAGSASVIDFQLLVKAPPARLSFRYKSVNLQPYRVEFLIYACTRGFEASQLSALYNPIFRQLLLGIIRYTGYH
jgi:hypothetical protein